MSLVRYGGRMPDAFRLAIVLMMGRRLPQGGQCFARVAELVDALDLESSGQPWGFNSPLSHHLLINGIMIACPGREGRCICSVGSGSISLRFGLSPAGKHPAASFPESLYSISNSLPVVFHTLPLCLFVLAISAKLGAVGLVPK